MGVLVPTGFLIGLQDDRNEQVDDDNAEGELVGDHVPVGMEISAAGSPL